MTFVNFGFFMNWNCLLGGKLLGEKTQANRCYRTVQIGACTLHSSPSVVAGVKLVLVPHSMNHNRYITPPRPSNQIRGLNIEKEQAKNKNRIERKVNK